MQYNFEKAIDLSHILENSMPIYPGDPKVSLEPAKTVETDGVNLTKITMGSHTGTHLDAPRHFIDGGEKISDIPVQKFMGAALVLDFSSKKIGSGIEKEDLRRELDEGRMNDGDFVLLYTGSSDHWGDPEFSKNYTYLAPSGAEYLVSKKARAVGIDFLSIEKYGEASAPTHKILLSNGVFIIESLSDKLKLFIGKRIFFIALPLKIGFLGDGAMTRAVAVPIEE